MYSQRTSRVLTSCAAAMKNNVRQQMRQQSQSSSSHMNHRSLSFVTNAWQDQMALREHPLPDNNIVWATAGQESLRVEFGDGTVNELPYQLLRKRCRCSICTGTGSGTVTVENDFKGDVAMNKIHPEIIQRREDGCLIVDWTDGHISRYTADWLRSADFVPSAHSIHNYNENM